MKQHYVSFPFKKRTFALVEVINAIVDEYASYDLTLTLRQIFYQLVSRDLIRNTEQNYNMVGVVTNQGKLMGLIDWDAIEDRTRRFRGKQRYNGVEDIMENAHGGFHMDMWSGQPQRVFVIIEKEALYGVFAPPCFACDAPLLAARGYPSGSVLREFAKNQIVPYWVGAMQKTVILHFGDHDPSGMDMSRDLEERLRLFSEDAEIDFERIALNMDQIDELKPPPNPAKVTDSRYANYVKKFGTSSWELDALNPRHLQQLVFENIKDYITDKDMFERMRAEVAAGKERIQFAAQLAGILGE